MAGGGRPPAFRYEARSLYNGLRMAVTVLFILYCVEAGLFFLVLPWSRFWSLNPLLHSSTLLGLIVDNVWARGLVSGFGIVHLIVGVREIVGAIERISRGARGDDPGLGNRERP